MPNTKMTVSQSGLQFIANWEGFYDRAYDDLQPKKILRKGDAVKGTLTIGFGTTVYPNGKKVQIGDTITKEKAYEYLKLQVEQHCSRFKKAIKVPLNQNQYDALASFSYNCGAYAITNNKALLNALNKKEWTTALNIMKQYNKSKGIVLKGLVNRRNKEAELFMKPVATTKTETKTTQTATSSTKPSTNKVKIKSSAKKYATGEPIPKWVKSRTYTVMQTKSDKVLLKEIYSWVKKSDVEYVK